MEEPEAVNHPPHYQGEFEAIEVCRMMPFSIGNTFKYVYRAGRKVGSAREQDYKKADWYRKDHSENRNPIQGLSVSQHAQCINLISKIPSEGRRSELTEIVDLAVAEKEEAVYQLFEHCLGIVCSAHQNPSLKRTTLDALRVAVENLKYMGEPVSEIKERVKSFFAAQLVWDQARREVYSYLFNEILT